MKKRVFLGLLVSSCSATVTAEPTSAPVKISEIRSYTNGDIYLHLAENTNICPNGVYRIPADAKGASQMYTAAMAALMADKAVRIEIPSPNVCPWGQAIQSIYLVK